MNYNISASSFRGFGFLNTVTNSRAKSMEKLSSGYRVNTASDDSARSAMSSVMRAQIRGLDQATRNSDHAIELLNSAESGLSEITSILQRIRELSVHAASDVNTPEDKMASQEEVEQLLAEIDRIAKSTEYNKIKLLNNEGNGENTKRGLAAVVGIQNITPDGKLSERPMIWDMMNPSTGGFGDSTIHNGNAGSLPKYSQTTEYRNPASLEQKNIYNNFQYDGGGNYTGDLYDAAGNKLGSVSNGGQATVDSPTNALLPENKQTLGTPSPYTKKSDCAGGIWAAPGTTTPNAPYSARTTSNSVNTSAASSNVYGKDASGNLVKLSYRKQTETLESGTSYSEYSNREFKLKGAHIDFKDLNQPGGFGLADLYGTGFNSSCATCGRHYSVKFQPAADLQIAPTYPLGSRNPGVLSFGNAGRIISFELQNSSGYWEKHQTFEMNIDALPANATGEDFAKHVVKTINDAHDFVRANHPGADMPFFTHYNQYAASGSKLYTFDYRESQGSSSGGTDTFSAISFGEVLDNGPTSPISLKIQAGANAYETVNISLPFISVKEMGIADVDLRTSSSASDAITLMDNALDFINLERTKIGSYRNRLEHVSYVDETSSLATMDSESKIRDTDMSSEIINFTKAQVLEEYGVNSVAEINKMIANVMEFIQ